MELAGETLGNLSNPARKGFSCAARAAPAQAQESKLEKKPRE
jgi:hypothetical protein